MLGLFFLGWFCAGCGTTPPPEPAVSVPSDCQKFLDQFFDAVKSKDVGKIKELSSHITPAASAGQPESNVVMMRETKGKMYSEVFERMINTSGDFQSYSVLKATETIITPADRIAANMMGAGIRAEIVCKAKFSKKESVMIQLNLFKETQEAEFFIEAWQFQAPL